MGVWIVWLICVLLYAALLELSRNTLPGWAVFGLVSAGFVLLRRWVPEGIGPRAACWFAFFLLLAVNLLLTQPPCRTVPAVEAAKPVPTQALAVEGGLVSGVRSGDGAVEVYAGIPYAQAPLGPLRWKEPQPVVPWEGVRSCDRFAPMAMQQTNPPLLDSLTQLLGTRSFRPSLRDNYREAVSEDCLYLNIWRPSERGDEALPVLFFIHGGSLMTGQPSYSEYRGEDLARRGIIVVNCGYRLGVFGYLAAEALAEESPNHTTGNYGLLDQIAALRWVRENIAAFGGDPERITVAGESAGASSVNALCVSPLTREMFRFAIAESSGITAKRPYHTFRSMESALEMGRAVMEEMGAEDLEALRALPAQQLVKTQYATSAMTVDGYAITEMPWRTYVRGANHEQALLNGFNAKEADVFLLSSKVTRENYPELLERIAPGHGAELAALVPVGSVERDQHFLVDAGGAAKDALSYVYSAAWFAYSHHLWSGYVAAENRPVYAYRFSKTNRSLSNYHAGELPYVFGNLWRHGWLYTPEDFALSEQMQAYWVNFVRSGDPNGAGLPRWEARNRSQARLLELGETVEMGLDPDTAIYEVLDKSMDETDITEGTDNDTGT